MNAINAFAAVCVSMGLQEPVEEFCFAPPRKWRFDYCWPEAKLALEIEGGVWTSGRHNRGSGFLKDMEKYNEACCLGWRILRCTPKEFARGSIIPVIQRALEAV